MRTYRVAAIPGDGIGTIAAGLEALEACARRDGGFALAFDHFDWGTERYKRTGAFMPADGLDQIRGHDAILFGSRPTCRTTSRCGVSGSPSASRSTSTPTCGQRASREPAAGRQWRMRRRALS